MTDGKQESSLLDIFSAFVEGEPNVLIVRFLRDRFTNDDEQEQVKASLDNVIAQQSPRVIAFDLANFDWFSEEVIELILQYRKIFDRTELHKPSACFVEKLAGMNLAKLFTVRYPR